MIDFLLSLPTLPGCLLFMALMAVIGLAVYYLTNRLHTRRQTEEALKEIKDATDNLFRVVGWLFTLLLSLTFTDVVSELAVTETAVENEAAALVDVHHNLRRFGLEETLQIRSLLVDYTRAVIDDDWPALASDRLSQRGDALLRQLGDTVMELETNNATQEVVHSLLIADLDRISDYRISRAQQAREKTSHVLIVVVLGYLVTMVYFGIYQPRRELVGLLALYTLFVGVIIYMILAMGDPFRGALSVDPVPMEYTLETIQGESD